MLGAMRIALLAALVVVVPSAAHAWSNQGHMATAAIAYDRLRASDPAAIAAVVRIMAAHPQAAGFARALRGVAPGERDRRLFMLIARWPDDIRGTGFDRPKWHYQGAIVTGWSGLRFEVGEAARAFAAVRRVAGDPHAPATVRAVALCWLFHITGDMQQPLHAGHRMDARFAQTDRLGTIGHVRQADDSDQTLHQLWDHALDNGAGPARDGAARIAAAARAIAILHDAHAGDFAAWTAESRALARRVAYVGVDEASPAGTPPPVSRAYLDRMRRVALLRLGQGGARLANVLAATVW
jgi:hypothetical protein